MRPPVAQQVHRETIREIALRYHVRNARMFCSALRGKATEGGDLDLLFEPAAETSLPDIGALSNSFKERVLKEAAPTTGKGGWN